MSIFTLCQYKQCPNVAEIQCHCTPNKSFFCILHIRDHRKESPHLNTPFDEILVPLSDEDISVLESGIKSSLLKSLHKAQQEKLNQVEFYLSKMRIEEEA